MPASSYHHGNLREALVAEAIKAVREQGPEFIAVRELARRVGVSHNAAYRHFAHRDDLVAAVAAHAYAELVETTQRRMDAVEWPDPVVRARRKLAEIGRAYVDFALAEPGLFRVAFTAPVREDAPPTSQGPYVLLAQVLDELVEVGFLSPEARAGAEVTCWSTVHGFSVLNTEGPLAMLDPDTRAEALDQVLVAIDRSYAASSGTSVDHRAILSTFTPTA